MPLLYLAKVNLNSNIFDVYDKKLSLKEVLNLIYEKIIDGTDYSTQNKERYIDSYGNQEVYIKESSTPNKN